jgi:hypothetical protein
MSSGVVRLVDETKLGERQRNVRDDDNHETPGREGDLRYRVRELVVETGSKRRHSSDCAAEVLCSARRKLKGMIELARKGRVKYLAQ